MSIRKAQIAKSIADNFGLFVAIPTFVGWLAEKFFGSDGVTTTIATGIIIWMLYTELRVQDLTREVYRKRRK